MNQRTDYSPTCGQRLFVSRKPGASGIDGWECTLPRGHVAWHSMLVDRRGRAMMVAWQTFPKLTLAAQQGVDSLGDGSRAI